jgi:hypothetical protein
VSRRDARVAKLAMWRMIGWSMVDEGGEFIARRRKSLSLAFTMRTEE